jgi:2-polyprenyl-3-methyl-5-hydroxy-6-metoxy-1,4-benzoquinol methylase
MTEHGDWLSGLQERAVSFGRSLKLQRQQLAPPEFWYPYGTMSNFDVINSLLTGKNRTLLRDINPKRAADIGGADGDVAFFLEQEGWDMTIIDNPPTNWNGLRGAKLFKEATGSKVQIVETDLDAQFTLTNDYDLVFFMGILYHLKNPFFALERLSAHARHAIISTRVMRWSKPVSSTKHDSNARQLLEHLPVAYLLDWSECNNDPTNFWIFSDAGLRRILDRSGWIIRDYLIIGEKENADPFNAQNDARAFALLESRRWAGVSS